MVGSFGVGKHHANITSYAGGGYLGSKVLLMMLGSPSPSETDAMTASRLLDSDRIVPISQ